MFKVGDEVRYSCGAGRFKAKVLSIKVRPTAKPGHSIPFMTLNVYGYGLNTNVCIAADKQGLAMYKVELV